MSGNGQMKAVGVDVGGTFTDLILFDPVAGDIRVAKVPTTIDNQAFGVLAALDETAVPLAEVQTIIHGTTTTTNALLERKVSPTRADYHPGISRCPRARPPHPAATLWAQGLVRAADSPRAPP